MAKEILFFVVIFLANIIQGITGFAGTILAMPFSIQLVGYDVAKPVLNVLGILSGIYVFVFNYKKVNWKQLAKIALVMAVGIGFSFFIKQLFTGKEFILYKILGVFVLYLSVAGLVRTFAPKKEDCKPSTLKTVLGFVQLFIAGIIHGLFVSGGPLVIGYLAKQTKDKEEFRATISTVWIFMNTMILITDIVNGAWAVPGLWKTQLIAIPFLAGGMFAGGVFYKFMDQKVFMILTYVLLFIAGVMLLIK